MNCMTNCIENGFNPTNGGGGRKHSQLTASIYHTTHTLTYRGQTSFANLLASNLSTLCHIVPKLCFAIAYKLFATTHDYIVSKCLITRQSHGAFLLHKHLPHGGKHSLGSTEGLVLQSDSTSETNKTKEKL